MGLLSNSLNMFGLISICVYYNVVIYYWDKETLSTSLKQSDVILLKNKPRFFLKNWRSICPLSVVYKIISRCIAKRLKQVLPDLIHEIRIFFCQIDLLGKKWTYSRSFDFNRLWKSIWFNFTWLYLEWWEFGSSFVNWYKILYIIVLWWMGIADLFIIFVGGADKETRFQHIHLSYTYTHAIHVWNNDCVRVFHYLKYAILKWLNTQMTLHSLLIVVFFNYMKCLDNFLINNQLWYKQINIE